MKKICVAHLVRACNGMKPFMTFIESYRQNRGGIEHDLLIIFKGFKSSQDTSEYEDLLVPFRHVKLYVSDEGFDITAYLIAVNYYSEQYSYFCFLNSYSVILDHNWLRKFYKTISIPCVVLVGASGSWGSGSSNAYEWFLRNILDIIGLRKNKRTNIDFKKQQYLRKPKYYLERMLLIVKDIWTYFQCLLYFDPFPNYHIRTNAFMISGKLMKTIECPTLKTKMDAYRFESGRQSMTRQILKTRKKVIVVGKDGRGYEKEEWDESRTFWQSNQENLLVADNQTRDYQEGSQERRRFLFSKAWNDPTMRNLNG